MSDTRRLVTGRLGWSNERTGCEFYQDVEGARWRQPREAYLTDALGDPEGSRVIVIVSRDRFDAMDDLYEQVYELVAAADAAQERKIEDTEAGTHD